MWADPYIRFKVTDHGIGMSPKTLAKLFQDFVQADASTAKSFGGTGAWAVAVKKAQLAAWR